MGDGAGKGSGILDEETTETVSVSNSTGGAGGWRVGGAV